MILKQKLKSYLHRKLSSLLGLNVFKAEVAQTWGGGVCR